MIGPKFKIFLLQKVKFCNKVMPRIRLQLQLSLWNNIYKIQSSHVMKTRFKPSQLANWLGLNLVKRANAAKVANLCKPSKYDVWSDLLHSVFLPNFIFLFLSDDWQTFTKRKFYLEKSNKMEILFCRATAAHSLLKAKRRRNRGVKTLKINI